MPAVTFELNAKEEGAVRGFLEVERASDKAGKSVKKAGKEGASSLEGFAKQAIAVAGGAAMISKAYNIVFDDIKKGADMANKAMDALLKTVSSSGDLSKLPQVRAQLINMAAPGLNMQGRAGLFGAVRGALPTEDLDQVMKLVRAAGAVGVRSGLGVEGTAELGGVMGELAKVYKNMSAEDLADRAKFTMESVGARGGKWDEGSTQAMLRLVASGSTAQQAHSLVLSGLEAKIGPSEIAALGDQLGGLAAVKGKMIKDPAAQSRIAEIEKELGGIDLEQEQIRRAGVADSGDSLKKLAGAELIRAKAAHDERATARGARLEVLRQREFDLREEGKGLANREVEAPLTQAEKARNHLASLPLDQRINEALAHPDLYAGALGSRASTFAALASRDPSRMEASLDEADRAGLSSMRTREGVRDPSMQAALARQIFQADEELARETDTKHQKREAFIAFARARAVRAGGGGLSQKLLDYIDSGLAVSGADPAEVFAGAEQKGLAPKGIVEEFNRSFSNVGRVLPGTDNSVVNVRIIDAKIPLGSEGRKAGDESIAGPED